MNTRFSDKSIHVFVVGLFFTATLNWAFTGEGREKEIVETQDTTHMIFTDSLLFGGPVNLNEILGETLYEKKFKKVEWPKEAEAMLCIYRPKRLNDIPRSRICTSIIENLSGFTGENIYAAASKSVNMK